MADHAPCTDHGHCRPGSRGGQTGFEAMMEMRKIDIAAIEAAWRG
jgi:hypothetical protein